VKGISRGMSTMSLGRKLGWIFMGLLTAYGPMISILGLMTPDFIFVSVGLFVIWVVGLVYLIATGKREKKGVESFLFAAGGFGSCTSFNATDGAVDLKSWHDVHDIELKRYGPMWRRLIIGTRSPDTGKFIISALDAGIQCSDAQAQEIHRILDNRIAVAQGFPPDAPRIEDDPIE